MVMSSMPQPEVEKKSSKLPYIITLVIIVGGLAGAIYYSMQTRMPSEDAAIEDEINLKVDPTPTEATAEDVDRSEYTIEILNGSGTAGVARTLQDLLEDEEFVVGDVGNADSYDYEETVIQAKEDVSQAYIKELQDTLSDDYTLAEIEVLDEDAGSDVVVIIGAE